MIHRIHHSLLTKRVSVLLVGAGGNGCRVLEALVNLHRAMRALGHPHGLDVTVVDPDTVSEANIGRQTFYACDIGTPKALTLVNRANMALADTSTTWKAVVAKVDTKSGMLGYDLVIGAVDNRQARLGILRSLESQSGTRYWLDLGNEAHSGQVVLGQVTKSARTTDDPLRLPHVGELYPELIDPKGDQTEVTPSCSLAEALQKQHLYVNQAVTVHAMNILWNLFTKGEIEYHGAFINLQHGIVTPLQVNPAAWLRFGVQRDGKRRKCERPSASAARRALHST